MIDQSTIICPLHISKTKPATNTLNAAADQIDQSTIICTTALFPYYKIQMKRPQQTTNQQKSMSLHYIYLLGKYTMQPHAYTKINQSGQTQKIMAKPLLPFSIHLQLFPSKRRPHSAQRKSLPV